MAETGNNRGFEHAVTAYAAALERFKANQQLPDSWFDQPDHLAIKCLDRQHYAETLRHWARQAGFTSEVKMDGRRLASLRLEDSLSFGQFGQIDWLEIMEPRPHRVGFDRVGIDHAEFVFPQFGVVTEDLAVRDLPYELEGNVNHHWISVVTDGYELKFTDKPLVEMVEADVRAGRGIIL